LLGTNEQEAALVDQWISFAVTELSAAMRLPNYFARGVYPFFKPVRKSSFRAISFLIPRLTILHVQLDVDGKEKLVTNLKILEAHLKTRTFLVGHRISSADIYLSSILKNGFSTQIDASIRQTIPNIVRYYNTVVNHPKIKPIFGETVWIEKAIQYSAAAKPKKVEAPKAAAAPAPPKEKAPKPAEDDEEEEESLVPQEPKVKNPLDDLPKSNFNLEDWKRAYSNMDTRGQGGSLEWFYQK
jgi:elongation factor 1-gamma